jgi:hypothetical protein
MTREHGSYVTYVQGIGDGSPPCRCDACRDANREYERARRRRITPAYVNADRARKHLADLAAAGIGLKSVAKASGVPHGSLSKIVYGDGGRGTPPSKRIRPDTERRILGVSTRDALDGARVPAGPTLANIERLRAKGWSKKAIAQAIGQKGPGLQVALKGTTVRARHARAIEALLDAPVPPRNPRDQHTRTAPVDEVEHRRKLDREDRSLTADLPDLTAAPGDWIKRGSCRRQGAPTWLFFPGRGDVETARRAKAICSTCPVQRECLDYALATDAQGIWGGTSGAQRRELAAAS